MHLVAGLVIAHDDGFLALRNFSVDGCAVFFKQQLLNFFGRLGQINLVIVFGQMISAVGLRIANRRN